jgi:hypothetical protein
MDIEEALEFVKWSGVFNLDRDTTFRGTEVYDGVTCRCKLTIRNRFVDGLLKCWTTLYTYGAQPNFYIVWDMTPFSFIVDWFLPVGELCDIIDRYNYITDRFDCVTCVYSLSYRETMQSGHLNITYEMFSRWVENRFPSVEFCYLHEEKQTSSKTILYRGLDAASLLIGLIK